MSRLVFPSWATRILGIERLAAGDERDPAQLRRVHRRIEAMLRHPLLHLVVSPNNTVEMMKARDLLRDKLGYPESLAIAIAQTSIDEEIEVRLQPDGNEVRLQPDGNYAFRLKPGCDVEELEAGLYGSG